MTPPTVTFVEFIRGQILFSKEKWLRLICDVIIPKDIARMDIKGNLQRCIEFLKARNAVIKEFYGADARSEVFFKGVKIGEFHPRITDKKLDIQAFIADVRVDVTPDEAPSRN